MEYRIKDISLADKGKKKIEWAEANMPVLLSLKNKFKESKPLKDLVVGGCLHVTKETAVLTKTLAAAGAIEAIISIGAMQQGIVPANLNWSTAMEEVSIAPAALQERMVMDHVMSNSFGFGGNNVSLIFSHA